jgi:DhnA family fructose-bisphosphate aldolase class Ia
MYNTGRLANTGYLSILPVDQGIEHSAVHLLQKILFTSIRKISLSWQSKVVAMLLLPRMAA